MDYLNDGSPKSYECECKASTRKRRSYLDVFGSDAESSTNKSKKIRSGDTKPPSKAKKDNCTGYFVESGWQDDEFVASNCVPKAGSHSSVGFGEAPQSKYHNSDDDNPNHYDHLNTSLPIPRRASASPDPRIHGFATLNSPLHTANQPPRKSHSIQKPDLYWRHEEQHAQAQPLIRAAWVGAFTVYCDQEYTCAKFHGFEACVSSKACPPARLVVEWLPPSIIWEKLPRRCLWPRSFERRGPTDDDIAVFFFPSVTKHESVYESLVFDLIREDAALRTSVRGSELLLFTSVELPPLFTRFQGKLYLWGVFRGDQPPL